MEKAREATTHIQKVETERDHKIRSLYADLEPEDRIADVMDESGVPGTASRLI